MTSFLHHWRIFGALGVAVLAVYGAYLLALGTASPKLVQASTESELLEQIAYQDTDEDGLPDWEEALFGTDPKSRDSRTLGMTDGEAVHRGLIVPTLTTPSLPPATPGQDATRLGLPSPQEGSLTDSFAKTFFTLYLSAKQQKGADLTKEEITALATKTLETLLLSVSATPAYKTESEITVSGAGIDALRSYATTAEGVFAAHASNLPRSELEYLQDLIAGDKGAKASIEEIARAYQDTAKGLAAISVPQEMQKTHLALVNAAMQMGNISNDFAQLETDPLSVMLALAQYKPAILALAGAFTDISKIFKEARILIVAGEAGYSFVHVIDSFSKPQP